MHMCSIHIVFNSKRYGHMAFCRFWKVEKTINKDFLLQYLAQFGGDLPTQLECEAWINCYVSHFDGPQFSTSLLIPTMGGPGSSSENFGDQRPQPFSYFSRTAAGQVEYLE